MTTTGHGASGPADESPPQTPGLSEAANPAHPYRVNSTRAGHMSRPTVDEYPTSAESCRGRRVWGLSPITRPG